MTDKNTDYAGKKRQERKQKSEQKMSLLLFPGSVGSICKNPTSVADSIAQGRVEKMIPANMQ